MIKLGISGAMGRMGHAITSLAHKDSDFMVAMLLEDQRRAKVEDSTQIISVVTENDNIQKCNVVIEFTLPEGTLENLKKCVEYKVPMVIGTTGFTEEGIAQIHKAAREIPIVFSSNMSIGVNILFKVTKIVAERLGVVQDIRIYEEHHIHKKDSPSGTAKTLGEIVQKASGFDVRYDPTPLREGEIIGNHAVTFETPFDTLTLKHHAKDRAMFALGALAAAKFLIGESPGLYSMQDVLA